MPVYLEELLRNVPSGTKDKVVGVYKRHNAFIRDMLRNETGFGLNRGAPSRRDRREETINVPVRIEPGAPEDVLKLRFDDSQSLRLMIAPYKRFLEGGQANLKMLLPLFDELKNLGEGDLMLRQRNRSAHDGLELIEELLNFLEEDNPVERILSVNKDILGVYEYRPFDLPSLLFNESSSVDATGIGITLYWGIIGLAANMLGVDVESLATVVLVHELAHAYTHVGADIDGKRWESRNFAIAEVDLKEGLAQYYTHFITERMSLRQNSSAFDAYEALLKYQPSPYHAHKKMVEGYSPEEVRMALLVTRREKHGNYTEFMALLESAREGLRRGIE